VSELNSKDELTPEAQETPVEPAAEAGLSATPDAAAELDSQEQPSVDEAEDSPAPQDASAAEEASVEDDSTADDAAASIEPEAEAAPASSPEQAPAAEPGTAAEPGEPGQNGRQQIGVPGMDWYIIHTYSGFENKVKESLRSRAEAFGFGHRVGEILIPTEDVVEMRGGKKVTSKRMLYPGYVLVQLDMDDELWHVVKNTPRVTGFVGGGQVPTPLTADEVNQTLYRQKTSAEKPRPKMTFEKNDRVKIVDGPFSNFSGSVEEVNEDRNTVKVMVTIFGRGTPVELEYFQVEKEGG
jgi:transcription termination/antitermination protein NusG